MSIAEMEIMRVDIVRSVINEQSSKRLSQIANYIKQTEHKKNNYPCQMTVEDLNEEVVMAVKDVDAGKYFLEDEMRIGIVANNLKNL